MAGRLGRLLVPVLAVGLMTLAVTSKATGAAASVLEALDTCIERLNPEIDVGYERIAGRCPQLSHRLEESGWSPWLPRDWKRSGNDLSAGGLRELREILSRELTVRGGLQERTRRPNAATLPAILTDLAIANTVRAGWWTRTKQWLRDVFERTEQDADAGWLGRLVGQNGLSQVALELTSYAALMLVVLLAVIIVVNELRVSGVMNRVRRRVARRPGASADLAEGGEVTWDEVSAVPLSRRPQLLLEVIIARLTEGHYLPPARALTVRELTRDARLADEGDRERFAQLARIAERVRFSSSPVPREELAEAVERGRVLFERLAMSAAPARS
jgi:hypothetical protein